MGLCLLADGMRAATSGMSTQGEGRKTPRDSLHLGRLVASLRPAQRRAADGRGERGRGAGMVVGRGEPLREGGGEGWSFTYRTIEGYR